VIILAARTRAVSPRSLLHCSRRRSRRRFVNADVIAHSLSPEDVRSVAIAAGRVMLSRMHDLAQKRLEFAIRNHLSKPVVSPRGSSGSTAMGMRSMSSSCASICCLRNRRCADRVRRGGHPCRLASSSSYMLACAIFQLYKPLAASWRVYERSRDAPATLIAACVDSHL